jgi:DNA-binding transcriptional regulator YdaS (Cro superfamily)
MEDIETPLERAIGLAGGMTALVRKLNERGKDIKGHATVYQWKQSRVPSDYCPDIEAITGVRCEDLRPDVAWDVLRLQGGVPDAPEPTEAKAGA